jgi:FAD/FMN-containing dehydrogenase
MSALASELKGIVKGEVLSSTKETLAYSEDASIFKIVPEVVVCPKDVADIEAVVRYVTEHKTSQPQLSVTARSGGTDMGGGPLNESIILDFTKHFNHIDGVEGMSCKTQPGVYFRDLESLFEKHGLMYASYPASKGICTIGGIVSNNSGGEKSLKYGQTKEYIEELRAVFSDGKEYVVRPLSGKELEEKVRQQDFEGQLYRRVLQLVRDNYEDIQKAKPTTSKNSSGYFLWDVWDKDSGVLNLVKLLVGSQGTLALITHIKLRLVRPAPKSELLVMFLHSLDRLGDIVHEVVQHGPETFESYDKHTFGLAMRYLPDMLKRMKGNLLTLGLQFLPELWMTLTGGIPELVLIAEFTGENDEEIGKRIAATRQTVEQKFGLKTHISKTPQETAKYWTIRRESFNLLRQHSKGKQTAPFIDDFIVHPSQLPEFLPRLNKIFNAYPHLVYTIAGHAGDANFHVIPIMDLSLEENHQIIIQMSHQVYDLVLEYGGSITAEHNDGLIRTPYLEKMYGSNITGLFKAVKEIFDPLYIFNPGKKVGATEQYIIDHIKRG